MQYFSHYLFIHVPHLLCEKLAVLTYDFHKWGKKDECVWILLAMSGGLTWRDCNPRVRSYLWVWRVWLGSEPRPIPDDVPPLCHSSSLCWLCIRSAHLSSGNKNLTSILPNGLRSRLSGGTHFWQERCIYFQRVKQTSNTSVAVRFHSQMHSQKPKNVSFD